MGRKKRRTQENDYFADDVAALRTAQWLVDLHVGRLDEFKISRECEDESTWDDFEAFLERGGTDERLRYQIKRQSTTLPQKPIKDLLCEFADKQAQYDECEFVVRELVEVQDIGELRVLRDFCERCRGEGVQPARVLAKMYQGEEKWLEFAVRSTQLERAEVVSLLGRLNVRGEQPGDIEADIERYLGQLDLPKERLEDVRGWLQLQIRELDGVTLKSGLDLLDELRSRFIDGASQTTHQPTKTPRAEDVEAAVTRQNNTFLDPYPEFEIAEQEIPREETTQVLEHLHSDEGASIVLLVGSAGYGKSGVLRQCFDQAVKSTRLGVIGLRLDRLTSHKLPLDELIKIGEVSYSPEEVLRFGTESGAFERGVLVLDQLDALSAISGDKADLYHEVGDLILRASRTESVSVLIACRQFDLDNDTRFQNLQKRGGCTTIALRGLSRDVVDDALARVKYTGRVSEQQYELLESPLHLRLACEVLNSSPDIELAQGEWELFGDFWELKERESRAKLGRNRWSEILRQIAEMMVENRTDVIRRRRLADYEAEIDMLVSGNVLVEERGDRVSFFHARFSDFIFARFFSGEVVAFLRQHDQLLARRNQVLGLLRERRADALVSGANVMAQYLSDLRALLTSETEVRPHIQHVVGSFLGDVAEPFRDELAIVLDLLEFDDAFFRTQARRILLSNAGWYSLLEEHGFFTEHLEKFSNKGSAAFNEHLPRALFASLLRLGLVNHPDGTIGHLKLLLNVGGDEAFTLIREVLGSHTDLVLRSEKTFNFLLLTLSAGVWDRDCEGLRIFDVSEEFAGRLLKLVEGLIRRKLERIHYQEALEGNDWSVRHRLERSVFDIPIRWDVVSAAAKNAPENATRVFLPLVADIIELFDEGRGPAIWDLLYNTGYQSDEDIFLDLVRDIASTRPRLASSLPSSPLERLANLDNQVTPYVYLKIWSSDGPELIGRAIYHIHKRVRNGDSLSFADGLATVASVFRSGYEKLTSFRWNAALDVVLSHYPRIEKDYAPGYGTRIGEEQYKLLSALPEASLHQRARKRLQELERRFDDRAKSLEAAGVQGGWINQVDQIDGEEMSDDAWMSYIRGANPSSEDFCQDPQVDKTLSHFAERQPLRFLRLLTERFNAAMTADSYNAVLWGCHNQRDDAVEIPDDLWFNAVRKAHAVARVATAQHNLWALREVNGPIPDDIVVILRYLLLDHSDPRNRQARGMELHTSGMNSIHGSAAVTIARMLAKDDALFGKMKASIERAVSDASTHVGSCVAELLAICLEHDREFAVNQFLRLAAGHPDQLLGAHGATFFLRYSLSTHLAQLLPIINRMLRSEFDNVRKAGGTALMLGTFRDDELIARVRDEMAGDKLVLQGVVEVLVGNIEELTPAQQELMLEVDNLDAEDETLQSAARAFNNARAEFLAQNRQFIEAYTGSAAFRTDPSPLIRALRRSDRRLTETTLYVCERFVEHCASRAADMRTGLAGDARSLMNLLFRIYADNDHKLELLNRVLDIIDELIRAGVWAAVSKLDEAD